MRRTPSVSRPAVLGVLGGISLLTMACSDLVASRRAPSTRPDPPTTQGLVPSPRSSVTSPPLAASPVTDPPTTVPSIAATSAPATTTPPATTAPKVALGRTLETGMRGDDVLMLQQRLKDLAFDPGVLDGIFGPDTAQAVWAYEKLVLGETGKAVDAHVTAQVWDRMQSPLGVTPFRPDDGGTTLEILLPQQVAVLYQEGVVRLVTHISTGTGEDWCAKGWCGKSITPGGVFDFTRRVTGWRESKLGRLYNPVYFNYGIAVHGMTGVPNYPASKGCVRIPMHIAEYFPSLVQNGDHVYVFDGVKEPEAYGAQPPPADTVDPNAPPTTLAEEAPSPTTTAHGGHPTTSTAATG